MEKDRHKTWNKNRGAYHHIDVQTGKLFTDINDTHNAYNSAIEYIFNNVDLDTASVIFATHNYESTIKIHNRMKKITI